MKKLIAILIIAAVSTTGTRAAPPSRASIDKLLVLSKVENARTAMLVQVDRFVTQSIQQAIQGQIIGPEDKDEIDAVHQKLTATISETLSWPMLKDLYEKAYAETFTQEEIDGLIAFYVTPAGRDFADKQPLVIQNAARLVQQRMREVTSKIQAEMRDILNPVIHLDPSTPVR